MDKMGLERGHNLSTFQATFHGAPLIFGRYTLIHSFIHVFLFFGTEPSRTYLNFRVQYDFV